MKNAYCGLIFVCLGLSSCDECEFKNQKFLEDYSGIVVEKKYYEWDHGAKLLHIEIGNGMKKYSFPTDHSYQEIWNQVEIGDSILKNKNDFNFSVYRNGLLIASKEIKYNCK